MFVQVKSRSSACTPDLPLELGSVAVPFVSASTHLGVRVTSQLSWSDHVSELLQRQRFSIFILKRLARRPVATEVVKRLYLGLVRPSLEYASPVWDACTKQDAVCLERAQLSVARAVLGCTRQTMHNAEVLRRIGWPTLAWRRRNYKLMLSV